MEDEVIELNYRKPIRDVQKLSVPGLVHYIRWKYANTRRVDNNLGVGIIGSNNFESSGVMTNENQ